MPEELTDGQNDIGSHTPSNWGRKERAGQQSMARDMRSRKLKKEKASQTSKKLYLRRRSLGSGRKRCKCDEVEMSRPLRRDVEKSGKDDTELTGKKRMGRLKLRKRSKPIVDDRQEEGTS
eukprot:scaffold1185_cov143-Skeletonema_menzelii.AAC.7